MFFLLNFVVRWQQGTYGRMRISPIIKKSLHNEIKKIHIYNPGFHHCIDRHRGLTGIRGPQEDKSKDNSCKQEKKDIKNQEILFKE